MERIGIYKPNKYGSLAEETYCFVLYSSIRGGGGFVDVRIV